MKRNFYLVMEAVSRKVDFHEPRNFINLVFASSDVKDHLLDKFNRKLELKTCWINGLFDFYMSIDTFHQIMFDDWFNKEIAALELTTIPHSMF